MAEFINTIDLLGDDVVMDSIIDKSITEFKDKKLTTVSGSAFYGCDSLTSIDLPTVTFISSSAFQNCTNLITVIAPSAQFEASTGAGQQFCGCSALTEVDISSATTLGKQMFISCTSLEKIVLPNVKKVYANAFNSCYMLSLVDFHQPLSEMGNYFYGCNALKALICRSESLIPMTSRFGANLIASGTGYIYVPRALIEDYKAATNWSTYADQFRALEDYTVDGTTTGELDESKI